MLIKCADDRSGDITALRGLLNHPDVSSQVEKKIRVELSKMQSGIKGESDAAHEIDFYFGTSKNWAVIHDLSVEHGTRSAQIDHLLISRFLEIWVCESKRFSEGIAINEHGEFDMFYEREPEGIASPLEQNKRHVAVLTAMANEGAINLPKRAGFSIKPDLKSLILVSTNARIIRPEKTFDGLDTILKVDQLKSRIDREIDNDKNPLNIVKVIGSETLKEFAEELAALHKPIAVDWHRRFGLSPCSQPISQTAKEATRSAAAKIGFVPCVGAICPTCAQGKLERRSVKRADDTETDFLSCSRYPEQCKAIFPLVALVSANVELDAAASLSATVPAEPKNRVGQPCPRCKTGKLVERKSNEGPFLGCSNYRGQNCRFTDYSWQKK